MKPMSTHSIPPFSSIERSAQHEAQRMEQKARGELDRQKLQNEKESEEARRVLLELQAVAAAVESSGQSKAEAQAQAEKLLIEGQSAIERELKWIRNQFFVYLMPLLHLVPSILFMYC